MGRMRTQPFSSDSRLWTAHAWCSTLMLLAALVLVVSWIADINPGLGMTGFINSGFRVSFIVVNVSSLVGLILAVCCIVKETTTAATKLSGGAQALWGVGMLLILVVFAQSAVAPILMLLVIAILAPILLLAGVVHAARNPYKKQAPETKEG